MMTETEKQTVARGVAALEGIFWLLLLENQADTPMRARFISPAVCEQRAQQVADYLRESQ